MQWECFAIVTVLWIFSVCLHEFGHAIVAYKGGDYTVVEKGYLTMNPLLYTHPIYSILMPVIFIFLGGIGLPGGAVYINHHLLRSKYWETAVSFAGPVMNILLVILIGAAFHTGLIPADPEKLSTISMAFLLQLEISSILLCLLPVPPLDGFQAIAPWLPPDVRQKAFESSNIGMFIVFLALWYVPFLNEAFWTIVFRISALLGVDPYWGYQGYKAFRFWENM